ncbi:MAG: GNAT family N-acetyltransferase [Pseudomonadota bacterium]
MAPTIRIEDPDQPALRAMLAEADAFYNALYPPEHNHLLDIAALQRSGVAFHVARIDGRIAGFGAVILQPGDWAEIRRMYVAPGSRGQGIGRRLLETLEAYARTARIRVLRLETGTRQPAALSLYRAAGFTPRGPFGAYAANGSSLFLEKTLA